MFVLAEMDIDIIMKSVSFNSKLIKQSFYWISAKDKEEIEVLYLITTYFIIEDCVIVLM